MVCLDELHRANEKVKEYGNTIEKSGHEKTSLFNMRDYVFKLGRHFYHNISALDTKIQSLKHGLSVSQTV